MRQHDLKVWHEYFVPLAADEKTLEIRKNDRGYQVGDILHLMDYDSKQEQFLGPEIYRRVTHIVDAQPFVPEGYVAMSVKPTAPTERSRPVEPLTNRYQCLNPPRFIDQHDCPGCSIYEACGYMHKDEYNRFKL